MESILARLRAIVGAEHVHVGGPLLDAACRDWTKRFEGKAAFLVAPGSTAEVAAVLACLDAARIPVVPQGGNTGMSGGATPDCSGRQAILSLTRLRRIRALDPLGNTIAVEAGVVLAEVQAAAREAGRMFPVSLGSEGSCTIGGALATNAGGVAVLRHGNMREQVLGLEVALADGRVLDLMTALRKDNSGYALRDLFIGSEGTLGVITAAVLKLQPAIASRCTAMVAVADLTAALALFQSIRARAGDRLTAFEFLTRESVALILARVEGIRQPFAEAPPGLVLLEFSDTLADAPLEALMEGALGAALEAGQALDAVLARSLEQARGFWRLREAISEAQVKAGKTVKHDIALPLSALADFVAEAEAALCARFPGLALIVFGHLGDGNLHYNVQRGKAFADEAAFIAAAGAINTLVHDRVAAHGGTISAEHGVGRLRRDELARYKPAPALAAMRALKACFDPNDILNPGALL